MGLVISAAVFLLEAASVRAADAGSSKRSNILLIVADDAGYSDFGPFGREFRHRTLMPWLHAAFAQPISP